MSSRRRYLRLLALGVAGAFPGCNLGESGGETPNTSLDSGAPATPTAELPDPRTTTASATPADVRAPTATERSAETETPTAAEPSAETPDARRTPPEPTSLPVTELGLSTDERATTGFGWSVALSGDRALVAATDTEHPNVVTGGTVYPFERSTGGDGVSDWTRRTRLDPEDDWYSFGGPLALRGDTAFVGARSTADANEDRTGAVLVFRRGADGWRQRAVLAPPSDESSGYFRRRFDATEEGLLIADPRFGSPPPREGSAFVFERSDAGWRRTARFGPDLDAEAPVPVAVAFDGDTALLTSYEHWDINHSPAGTVHVYERDGDAWSREATLTAPADVSADEFGFRTALSDGRALVQAPAGDSVIGFERTADGWRHRARLEAPGWYAAEGFGASLAFDGDCALVGAPTDADSALDRDWVFVYERDGSDWIRSAALAAPDGDADEEFGNALALADGTALVGAPGDEDRPSRGVAGSTFAFSLDL